MNSKHFSILRRASKVFAACTVVGLLGSGLGFFSMPQASAAEVLTMTTTNCSGSTPGTISYSVSSLIQSPTLIYELVVTKAGQAEDFVAQLPKGTTSKAGTLAVGSEILLPMSATGAVGGTFELRFNGTVVASSVFNISGCGGLRKVVVDKVVVGVPPVGATYGIDVSGLSNLIVTVPSSGGSFTVAVVGAFFVSEQINKGYAASVVGFDLVRNVLGASNSVVSIPAVTTDEHVRITNFFVSRPVSVGFGMAVGEFERDIDRVSRAKDCLKHLLGARCYEDRHALWRCADMQLLYMSVLGNPAGRRHRDHQPDRQRWVRVAP
jgi:hypothetical protein